MKVKKKIYQILYLLGACTKYNLLLFNVNRGHLKYIFELIVVVLILQNNKPLYSFEDNSDYVYDVMWSPTHPALFACVDGVGHLDLWNLNNDTEVRG